MCSLAGVKTEGERGRGVINCLGLVAREGMLECRAVGKRCGGLIVELITREEGGQAGRIGPGMGRGVDSIEILGPGGREMGSGRLRGGEEVRGGASTGAKGPIPFR